jgi:hypothetical protein
MPFWRGLQLRWRADEVTEVENWSVMTMITMNDKCGYETSGTT